MIKDPYLLFSIVNTALRDNYESLTDYCLSEGVNEQELLKTLESAGFYYDSENNCFKKI